MTNCLTYLLDLIDDGEELELFYNGNHCIGIDKDNLIWDFNFSMRGDESKYLPIEKCHTKEMIKKIFNLNEQNSKTLDEYYLLHTR
jgi:hypothetical protein